MKTAARLLILMLWLLGQMPGFAYDISQWPVELPTITYDGWVKREVVADDFKIK